MKKLITIRIEQSMNIDGENHCSSCDVSVTEPAYDNENRWYLFYTCFVLINGKRKFEVVFAVSRMNYEDFHTQLRPTECGQYRITKKTDSKADIYEISTSSSDMRAILSGLL